MTPKVVPFYANSDNFHCQQVSVKSVLKYFFPDSEYSDTEIDEGTAQTGGTTWFPPAVIYLDHAGLSVQLYSSPEMDYKEFAERGKEYIREKWRPEHFHIQENSGAFTNMDGVQEAARKMLEKRIWKREAINIEGLGKLLDSPNVLAIGKTYPEWLSGIRMGQVAHYVVIIENYDHANWIIHDSNPPGIAYRVVSKELDFEPMFSEVLVISKIQ